MKIVFFTGDPIDDSALWFRTGKLALELKKRGHEIYLYSVSNNYKKKDKEILKEGLLINFIGQAHYLADEDFNDRKKIGTLKYLFESIFTYFRLRKEIKTINPDVVGVITTLPVSLLVIFFLRFSKHRAFIDINDSSWAQISYKKGFFLTKIYQLFEYHLPYFGDKIVVCSYFLEEKYRNSVRIPNFVDLKEYQKKPDVNLKKEYGLRKFVIVFEGTLGIYHGQDIILDIAEKMKKIKGISFVIIGGGEGLLKLKKEVRKRKLESSVVLTGRLSHDKLVDLILISDVGILPMWESDVYRARNPIKLLEYLAGKLVVLSSGIGDVAKILENKKSGIFVNFNDCNAICEAIEKIYKNDVLRKEIIRIGYNKVKNYDIAKVIIKWEEFFKSYEYK